MFASTATSFDAYPTEENTKVNGAFCVVTNLKFPLSSVKVPAFPPLTVTETAVKVSEVDEFLTVPVMAPAVWAFVEITIIMARQTNPNWLKNRFINVYFYLNCSTK